MGITLTDVLLFGKAQSDDVDNATLVIYRRNILRWSALGGYIDVIVKGVSPLSLPDAIADSLQYVKAFGGTEQRNLPDNYLQRQFIYMMDGSYLLTDLVPQSAYKIELDFQTTSQPATGGSFVGSRDTASVGAGIQLGFNSSGKFTIDGMGSRYTSTNTIANNTRYKFTWNNGLATIETGGSVVDTNTFTPSGTNTYPLVINGLNNAGTPGGGQAGIYLYSFKIWNAQGELIADYVPAVQKGTVPVVGFYDTVSETFMTATSGTFAAGGEAVPTPDAPMDIVCNNGVLKLSPNLFNKATVSFNTLINQTTGQTFTPSPENHWSWASDYIKVQPNTTYYFMSGANYNVRFFEYDASKNYLNNHYTILDSSFTTGATCEYVRFHIGDAMGGQEMYEGDTQLELGSTATSYMPYGQIYTDGTVETIRVVGKNLYNKANGVLYGYPSASNVWLQKDSNTRELSIMVKLIEGQTYTATRVAGAEAAFRIQASSTATLNDGQSLREIDNTGTTSTLTKTFIVPAGYPYVLFYVRNVVGTSNLSVDDVINGFQVELGSTATSYVPYFDGGTATCEDLLSVGTYTDEQEVISGGVTRKVGVKVLDGTENWVEISTSSAPFRLQATDLSFLAADLNEVITFCTHFQGVARNDTWANYSNMVSTALTNDIKYLAFMYLNKTATLAQFKQLLATQYAAGTPVIVVYPLSQATTETVAGQALQVQAGDNTLEITQASLNNLQLEAQYQASVSLTIQEVQDANLDPNVEVTII